LRALNRERRIREDILVLIITWRSAIIGAAFVVLTISGACVVGKRCLPESAGTPSADDRVRQANEAFARQDYEDAVKLYEQAEAESLDPGLVSRNKAAAYYRLGDYKAAVAGYRRCLDDEDAPPLRRARAHFDLGNALVRYGPDNAPQLAEAVRSYHACLLTPDLPPSLRTDARHNLELAQLLWLKAWQKLPEAQKNAADSKPKEPDDKKKDGDGYQEVKLTKDHKKKEVDNLPDAPKPKNAHADGVVQYLPDDDKVRPLSEEDAWATLKSHVERIAEARRRQRNPDGPANLATKDW